MKRPGFTQKVIARSDHGPTARAGWTRLMSASDPKKTLTSDAPSKADCDRRLHKKYKRACHIRYMGEVKPAAGGRIVRAPKPGGDGLLEDFFIVEIDDDRKAKEA